MRKEKIKFILLMMAISVLGIMPQVYAKTSIEIKPNSTVYTNKTISEFFDESMAMKNTGEGLEGSNVDVHMATNTDWAIFSYFSNSQYGTGGEGKNTGTTVSIDGTSYLSTNGNVTGMMNFGKTITFTSGVISNYADIETTSNLYECGKNLILNVNNDKYVDKYSNNSAIKKAIAACDWYSKKNTLGNSTDYPYSARSGLFGFHGGVGPYIYPAGVARTECTFRPVIWN